MKLKYDMTIMNMGDEYAAVPVGDDVNKFHGMLKLNRESAELLEQLKQDTDPMKLHKYMKEKHPELTDDEIGQMIVGFLNKLVRADLLAK